MTQETQCNVFATNLPLDLKLQTIVQDYYLSDGKIAPWNGPMQEIFAPMSIEGHQVKLGSVPKLDAVTANAMLDAAKKAFDGGLGVWPMVPYRARIDAMNIFVQLMQDTRAKIVQLLQWEICKTTADSEKEFDRTIDYVVETIAAYEKIMADPDQHKLTPRGVVLCMGPYNYPLNELFTTVIPALITGNVVIIKPARIGVLLFEPLLECFQQAFPAGVVNVIYGDGKEVITPQLTDGGVDSLAFIGGDKTADILMSNHPHPHRLHTVLGLGAKNPAIILDNADIDKTVQECVAGALSFNGQRCTALKILFVPRSKATVFAEKFAAAVNQLTIGLPWETNIVAPHQTPLPETGKVQAMKAYVDDALAKGATIANGEPEYGDSLMKPVVLLGVTPDALIYNEEQFGPVVPVVIYDDVQEVIEYMKQSPYGQQVSIFTETPLVELDHLIRPLSNLVCRINVNTQCMRSPDTMPFTGRKSSAKGVLSIEEALKEFTLPCVVHS